MLTPFKGTNGDEIWVNPIHVRCVMPERGLLTGGKGTAIYLGQDMTTGLRVVVNHTPADVAAAINAAMPALLDLNSALGDDSSKRPSSD